MTASEIILKFRQQGIRITEFRKYLIQEFIQSHQPISAQEILATSQKIFPTINKTTVYRELDFLLLHRIIHQVELGDRKKRFELSSHQHHHHLICLKCRKIEDIHLDNDLSKQEKIIEQTTDFLVTDHSLEFFGYCSNCR